MPKDSQSGGKRPRPVPEAATGAERSRHGECHRTVRRGMPQRRSRRRASRSYLALQTRANDARLTGTALGRPGGEPRLGARLRHFQQEQSKARRDPECASDLVRAPAQWREGLGPSVAPRGRVASDACRCSCTLAQRATRGSLQQRAPRPTCCCQWSEFAPRRAVLTGRPSRDSHSRESCPRLTVLLGTEARLVLASESHLYRNCRFCAENETSEDCMDAARGNEAPKHQNLDRFLSQAISADFPQTDGINEPA